MITTRCRSGGAGAEVRREGDSHLTHMDMSKLVHFEIHSVDRMTDTND